MGQHINTGRNVRVRMAIPHLPNSLLMATGIIWQAVRTQAAAATSTRDLKFNPVQEETTLWRKLRVGALLDTARTFKTRALSQELRGNQAQGVAVCDALEFASLRY